jgi:hypothetical protein
LFQEGKKKKKDDFRPKINKLSVKENYMKFDQFFVIFARDEIGWSTKCIQLYWQKYIKLLNNMYVIYIDICYNYTTLSKYTLV